MGEGCSKGLPALAAGRPSLFIPDDSRPTFSCPLNICAAFQLCFRPQPNKIL